MAEFFGGGPIGPTFFAMDVKERICQRCGADYTAHGSRLECPAWAFQRNKEDKNLRAEFDAKFTIMGSGGNLDEMDTADEVWAWILENFEPKEKS